MVATQRRPVPIRTRKVIGAASNELNSDAESKPNNMNAKSKNIGTEAALNNDCMDAKSKNGSMKVKVEKNNYQFGNFIGPTLANFRVIKKKTQLEVIDSLGADFQIEMTQSNLSKIETGKQSISVDKFLAYCDILNVSPADVFKASKRMYEFSQLKPSDD